METSQQINHFQNFDQNGFEGRQTVGVCLPLVVDKDDNKHQPQRHINQCVFIRECLLGLVVLVTNPIPNLPLGEI